MDFSQNGPSENNNQEAFMSKMRGFAAQLVCWTFGIVLLSGGSGRILAQSAGTHIHGATAQAEAVGDQSGQAETLVQVVRDATERYKDVAVAKSEGFVLTFGCVQGPDSGAMGMHFLNASRLTTNLDPTQPQIL